jgi:hypothetical protein
VQGKPSQPFKNLALQEPIINIRIKVLIKTVVENTEEINGKNSKQSKIILIKHPDTHYPYNGNCKNSIIE